MSAAGFASPRERLRTQVEVSYRKGTILSHLLGAIIASEFVVGSAAGTSVPYVSLPMFTDWLDFPLRMVAIWLLIDRNWRIGRLRLQLWDFIVLAFPIVIGLAYPFLANDPSVSSDFESYRRFLGTTLRFYTVYILMREGYNRAGFRGDIVIRWVLGALSLSALTAMAQALNVGGIRAFTTRFYHVEAATDIDVTGYRARGFAAHWNGFAAEMVFAIVLLVSPLNWRRLYKWEWAMAGLLTAGLIVSTSRAGYGTMAVVVFAAGCYFLWTRRYRTGLILLGGMAAALLLGAFVALTIKSKLFTELLQPPKVRSLALGSVDYRLVRVRALVKVWEQHPIFGTGPSQTLYDNPKMMYHSESSVEGVKDVSYSLILAQFGIIGILYIAGVIYSLVRFGSRRRSVHPYAMMAFLVGIAFATDSLAEIVFITQPMILVSMAAACSMSRVSSYSAELGGRKFAPQLGPRV